jgi:ribonuclease P protein component
MIVLPAPRPRLGITVTKRVASAVGRNRIKRCVREVYRRNRELFPGDCELVVVARRGADALGYEAVRAEMAAASPALQRAARSARARQQRPDPHGRDGGEGER